MNRRKKKCRGSCCDFLDQRFFCFERLQSTPGLLFPLVPSPSERSKRHAGTGRVSMDLEIRKGLPSSHPSCLWKNDGSFLPVPNLEFVTCVLAIPPTHILVALLVLTKNAGIYELSSFDPFGWIYQHSLMLLTKEVFRWDDHRRLKPDPPKHVATLQRGPRRLFHPHVVSARKSLFWKPYPERTKSQSFCFVFFF